MVNSILTVDLGALRKNYKLFQSMVGDSCDVAGIVKANGYGLGVEPVTQVLKKLNCPLFYVATLDEALELRGLELKEPIIVLGGIINDETAKEYLGHNITPTLNTLGAIQNWQNLSQKKGKKLPAILHFDTGINRLGLSVTETNQFLDNKNDYNAVDIRIVMSHFSCVDEENHPLTKKQANRFAAISAHFPKAKKSLSNSSGLFRDKAHHYDMVRPGYALYGGNPTPEKGNPVSSVVSLHSPILQIRDCKKGESIGYGATHVFEQDTRTATVGLGYADGLLRSNSSKASFYYNGQACPVLGRVSMDLVSIDVSKIVGKPPKQGNMIEILGENQTIDVLANSAGTIGYEILTSLGSRYKREYI